jgi:hypothetical protein
MLGKIRHYSIFGLDMKTLITSLIVLFISAAGCFATHLRSGTITVVQQNSNSLTVSITITVFINTIHTNVLFGGDDDILDFGDGSDPDDDGKPGILIPETPHDIMHDLGYGVARASYTIMHTYAGNGIYIISYLEPNRNEGVINMDNSTNTRFYLESKITLGNGKRYESPVVLLSPTFRTIAGEELTTSFASRDTNDYQLLYKVVTPKQKINTEVVNYRLPEKFVINPYNGLVTWDGKFNGAATAGPYAFAVKVTQLDSSGTEVGYVVHDFQILATEQAVSIAMEDEAELDENNAIQISENDSTEIKCIVTAAGVSELILSAYTELSSEQFTFHSYDTVINENEISKIGLLKLVNSSAIVRDHPYAICIRATAPAQEAAIQKDISYLFYPTSERLTLPEIPPAIVGIQNENIREDKYVLYPNPFTDFILLPTEADHIMIFDLQGRKISFEKDRKIDMSHVYPGVYFVEIRSGNHTKIVKAIKK